MTIRHRRVHDQSPRNDYLINAQLGLATVRTDKSVGVAVFEILAAPVGLRGLYLSTGAAITRMSGRFTMRAPGLEPVTTRTLDQALLAYSLNSRSVTTEPSSIPTLTAAAA